MPNTTARAAVTDTAAAVFTGLEGESATLVNRGPNACVVADTEAACDPGTGPEDTAVGSFHLAVGDFVDVDLGSRADDVWAVCAAGESACLHIIGAEPAA